MWIKDKVFNRRALILGCIQLAISAAFSYRLYVLQVKNRKKYEILSQNNRVRVTNVIPRRGKILDRNGIELAVDMVSYALISSGNRKEISWVDVESSTPESNIVAFYKRYYPFGQTCSHILGYTRREINKQIGIIGIEHTYNNVLEGIPGKIVQEVNARKHVIRELLRTSPQNGQDIQLTIDINLQKEIAEMCREHKSSVIVIDAKNGEVLALHNSPSYDNNLFSGTLSHHTWQNLNINSLPLINRALSYQIPPGSVFQIIVALAALQDGIIAPEDKFFCKGYMKIGNRKFHCWKRDGHGYLSLREAIVSSCNVYFYNIGKELNVDSLTEMASRFGVGNGSLMGIFKEEASGLLPHKDWREQRQWKLDDTMNLVVGQKHILVTPLQLAVLAARIATCKEVLPHIETKQTILPPNINISEMHIDIVRQAMFDVVNANVKLPQSMNIAGKTGTPVIDSSGNSHKLFITYSSSHYAISVFIEQGESPRQDCSIAYKIFNYMGVH